MKPTTRLRHLIDQPELLVMPGVFDPLSAKIAAQAGFPALQCTGAGISATHLGLPDYSMLSMSDMVDRTGRIAAAVDVPVMGDGDTGFGNAVNTYYTVRAFERAGAAGVNIEDQVMPKRCGHLDGKQLLDIDEAAMKIAAAADARRDPDFVINARTDALATGGLDEVIVRGNAYLAAGATMVFVEGIGRREDVTAAVAGINGPVAMNLVEGGRTPSGLTFTALQEMGVARVSLPGAMLQAAMKAMQVVLQQITADGGTDGVSGMLVGLREAHTLLGMSTVTELENHYLAPLQMTAAS
ncbi:MAG: isocitrate lyase/PEP mutase family protein [Actinomycetota bacterium]|nr:isocitrate lyase/PEP mutase family protein [Actinomycetota bacterium]